MLRATAYCVVVLLISASVYAQAGIGDYCANTAACASGTCTINNMCCEPHCTSCDAITCFACEAGYAPSGTSCAAVPSRQNGAACSANADCDSDNCRSGSCCTPRCTACNYAGCNTGACDSSVSYAVWIGDHTATCDVKKDPGAYCAGTDECASMVCYAFVCCNPDCYGCGGDGYCTYCADGKSLVNGHCVQLAAAGESCTLNSDCTSNNCNNFYGHCCPDRCTQCNQDAVCTQCIANTYINMTGGAIGSCNALKYPGELDCSVNAQCISNKCDNNRCCDASCGTCDNGQSGWCASCDSNWHLTDGLCYRDPLSAGAACTAGSQCASTACANGVCCSAPLSASCCKVDNCTSCDANGLGCTQCPDGYYMVIDGNGPVSCSPQKNVADACSGDDECLSSRCAYYYNRCCAKNCIVTSCTPDGTCNQCDSGYIVQAGACVLLLNNGDSCTSSPACSSGACSASTSTCCAKSNTCCAATRCASCDVNGYGCFQCLTGTYWNPYQGRCDYYTPASGDCAPQGTQCVPGLQCNAWINPQGQYKFECCTPGCGHCTASECLVCAEYAYPTYDTNNASRVSSCSPKLGSGMQCSSSIQCNTKFCDAGRTNVCCAANCATGSCLANGTCTQCVNSTFYLDNGMCNPKGGLGAYCRATNWCLSNGCSLNNNNCCAPSSSCCPIYGCLTCTNNGGAGTTCSQCRDDLVLHATRGCAPAAGSRQPGQECFQNVDCSSNGCLNGVCCTSYQADCQYCDWQGGCGWCRTSNVINGVCTPFPDNSRGLGSTCVTTSQCNNGICDKNTCCNLNCATCVGNGLPSCATCKTGMIMISNGTCGYVMREIGENCTTGQMCLSGACSASTGKCCDRSSSCCSVDKCATCDVYGNYCQQCATGYYYNNNGNTCKLPTSLAGDCSIGGTQCATGLQCNFYRTPTNLYTYKCCQPGCGDCTTTECRACMEQSYPVYAANNASKITSCPNKGGPGAQCNSSIHCFPSLTCDLAKKACCSANCAAGACLPNGTCTQCVNSTFYLNFGYCNPKGGLGSYCQASSWCLSNGCSLNNNNCCEASPTCCPLFGCLSCTNNGGAGTTCTQCRDDLQIHATRGCAPAAGSRLPGQQCYQNPDCSSNVCLNGACCTSYQEDCLYCMQGNGLCGNCRNTTYVGPNNMCIPHPPNSRSLGQSCGTSSQCINGICDKYTCCNLNCATCAGFQPTAVCPYPPCPGTVAGLCGTCKPGLVMMNEGACGYVLRNLTDVCTTGQMCLSGACSASTGKCCERSSSCCAVDNCTMCDFNGNGCQMCATGNYYNPNTQRCQLPTPLAGDCSGPYMQCASGLQCNSYRSPSGMYTYKCCQQGCGDCTTSECRACMEQAYPVYAANNASRISSCVYKGGTGMPCNSSMQCYSNFCDAGRANVCCSANCATGSCLANGTCTQCVNSTFYLNYGMCNPKTGLGSYCQASSWCLSNQCGLNNNNCCEASPTCCPLFGCLSCTNNGGAGTTCTQCRDGLQIHATRGCAPAAGSRQPGQECYQNPDCSSNVCLNGVCCTSYQSDCMYCQYGNGACGNCRASNLFNGVCTPFSDSSRGLGQTCNATSQCINGICDKFVCCGLNCATCYDGPTQACPYPPCPGGGSGQCATCKPGLIFNNGTCGYPMRNLTEPCTTSQMCLSGACSAATGKCCQRSSTCCAVDNCTTCDFNGNGCIQCAAGLAYNYYLQKCVVPTPITGDCSSPGSQCTPGLQCNGYRSPATGVYTYKCCPMFCADCSATECRSCVEYGYPTYAANNASRISTCNNKGGPGMPCNASFQCNTNFCDAGRTNVCCAANCATGSCLPNGTCTQCVNSTFYLNYGMCNPKGGLGSFCQASTWCLSNQCGLNNNNCCEASPTCCPIFGCLSCTNNGGAGTTCTQCRSGLEIHATRGCAPPPGSRQPGQECIQNPDCSSNVCLNGMCCTSYQADCMYCQYGNGACGWCRTSNLTNGICTPYSDNSRRFGETCNATSQCINGICDKNNICCSSNCSTCTGSLTDTTSGQSCPNPPCGPMPGQCASCKTGFTLNGNGSCVGGSLNLPKPPGGVCLSSAECVAGSCFGGYCCANATAGGSACATCNATGLCATCDFATAYLTSVGTCARKLSDGLACASPSQCVSGLCTAAKCVSVTIPVDPTGKTVFAQRRLLVTLPPSFDMSFFTVPNPTYIAGIVAALAAAQPVTPAVTTSVLSYLPMVPAPAVFIRVVFSSESQASLDRYDSFFTGAVTTGATFNATGLIVKVVDFRRDADAVARPIVSNTFAGRTTACSESVTLTLNELTTSIAGRPTPFAFWSAVGTNITMLQRTGATMIANIPVGETVFSVTAVADNNTASAAQRVTRLAPLASRITAAGSPSNTFSTRNGVATATVPTGVTVSWTVTTGSAVLTNAGSLTVAIEGSGPVTVLMTASDPLGCGEKAYVTVNLVFPALPTCNPATTCGGHGQCRTDGSCDCYASALLGYFAGLDCGRCATGYVGGDCKLFECSSTNCFHGTCSNDLTRCNCHSSASLGYWTGARCDACASKFTGATCLECEPGYFPQGTCTVYCSDAGCGNGRCGADGACVCYASAQLGFWGGNGCRTCVAPYAGPNCLQTCNPITDCNNHGKCVLDTVANAYRCQCDYSANLGFYDTAAQSLLVVRSQCTKCATNYVGDDCKTFTTTDPTIVAQRVSACKSSCVNGACDAVGTCTCRLDATQGYWGGERCNACAQSTAIGFWGGDRCNQCTTGYYGDKCQLQCPGLCSGHGACGSTGACTCDVTSSRGFWTGSSCNTCANNYYGAECRIRCVAGDTCVGGTCEAATGVCTCYADTTNGFFEGASCNTCAGGRSRDTNCRQCLPGRYGPSCIPCSAAEKCGGRGECSSDGLGCVCYANQDTGFWAGASCGQCTGDYLPPDCKVSASEAAAALSQACQDATAPVFVSAAWRAGFVGVTLTMNADVVGNAADCAAIFSAATVAAFGTNARCSWSTSKVLLVDLGTAPTLGETVVQLTTLFGGVYAKAGGVQNCRRPVAAAVLSIALPTNVGSVTVSANAPTVIGSCDGVTIDVSRTRTPSPRSRYSISLVDGPATSELLSALQAAVFTGAGRVTVPDWALTSGTYTFKLAADDLITGLTGSTTVTVTKGTANPPLVSITRPGKSEAAKATTLVASAEYSRCTSSAGAAPLAFQWTISPTPLKDAGDNSRATFTLPARSLLPGTPYTVTVNATDAITGISATAVVIITPTAAALTAKLTLPGTLHPKFRLNMAWACADPDGSEEVRASVACISGCTSSLEALIDQVPQSSTQVAGSSWSDATGANAVFRLTCSADTRTATDTITIVLSTDEQAPSVRIAPTATAVSAGAKWGASVYVTLPNADAASSASDRYDLLWTCTAPCDLDFTSANVVPMGTTSTAFVVAEDALAAGTYNFVLSLTDRETTVQYNSTVTLSVYPYPTAGQVLLSGITLGDLTLVTVTASGFVAGDPALEPLRYSVSILNETGELTVVSSESATSTASFRVPSTPQLYSSRHVLVQVIDAINGQAEVAVPIVGVPAVVSFEELAADVEAALRRGASGEALGAMSAAASTEITDPDTLATYAGAMSVIDPGQGTQAAALCTALLAQPVSLDQAILNMIAVCVLNGLGDVVGSGGRPGPAANSALDGAAHLTHQTNSRRRNNKNRQDDDAAAAEANAAAINDVIRKARVALTSNTIDGETVASATKAGSAVACGRSTSSAGRGIEFTEGLGGVSFTAAAPSATGASVGEAAPASDLCTATIPGNRYAAVDPEANVTGGITSISLTNSDGSEIPVTNTPMTIVIPLVDVDPSVTVTGQFYDEVGKKFASAGCRDVERTATKLVLECVHLTDFAAIASAPHVNKVEFGNFEDVKLAAIIYIVVLTGILIALMPLSFLYDQWRQRQFKDAALARANLAIARVQAACDAAAADPDSQTVLEARAPVNTIAADPALSVHVQTQLKTNHPWAAPFFMPPSSNFTVPQRIHILFLTVIVQLFCNGLFFDDSDTSPEAAVRQTVASIVVSVPVVIIASLLTAFWYQNGARSAADARNSYQPEDLDVDSGDVLSKAMETRYAKGSFGPSALRLNPVAVAFKLAAEIGDVAATKLLARLVDPRGTNMAEAGALRLTATDLGCVAESFATQRRHLIAVTLHTLSTADAVVTALNLQRNTEPESTFVAMAVKLLGYTSQVSYSVRPQAHSAPRSAYPFPLLSLVLHAYLGAASPTVSTELPETPHDPQLMEELYGEEMHGCVWRLAIECVKEHELSLAEALFTLHLLMEHPDLFLVLFETRVPETFEELMSVVCIAAHPASPDGRASSNLNVGRLWSAFYAAHWLFTTDSADYDALLAASTPVTPAALTALLGLNETRQPVVQGGCVPYVLQVETNRMSPALGSIPGLSFFKPTEESAKKADHFESLILQAHALRLAHKPFVDQRWFPSVDDRIAVTRASPMKAPEPTRAAAEEATKKASTSLSIAERLVGPDGVEPHAVPVSVISAALTSIGGLRTVSTSRSKASMLGYSTRPVSTSSTGFFMWALQKLDKRLYSSIVARDSSHGNFYATIEYGRLMALFHNVRTKRMSMQQFGEQYVRESNTLQALERADLALEPNASSWEDSVGVRRRDRDAELVLSNIFRADAVTHNMVLHRLITRAALDGDLRIPTAVPCQPHHLAGLQSRLAMPVRHASGFPLAVLAHHQPPTAAGCGTITTPHLGICAAVQSARLGEVIELVGGTYGPTSFANIHGTIKQPVIVQPVGYERMLHVNVNTTAEIVPASIVAELMAKSTVSDSNEPFPSSNPIRAGDNSSRQPDAPGIDEDNSPVASRPLHAAERRQMARCTIAAPIGVSNGVVERLLTVDRCEHVLVRGIEFRRGRVAVEAFEPVNIKLTHCVVDCHVPFRSNVGGDAIVPETTNEVHSEASKWVRMLWAGDLDPNVRFLGYAIFTVLYVMFALLCLFLTSNFSDDKADEWIIRSVVTTVVVALLVQPVTTAALAVVTFSNAVLFTALNSLSTFIPL
jgi:hypothetical protein